MTATANGWPPAEKTWTTAASRASRPPSANPRRSQKDEVEKELGIFSTTPRACATSGSAPAACSSAPASSKRAAKRSSPSASNRQECTGPPPALTPSSPCAAAKPAAPGKRSAARSRLRDYRLTRRAPKMILDPHRQENPSRRQATAADELNTGPATRPGSISPRRSTRNRSASAPAKKRGGSWRPPVSFHGEQARGGAGRRPKCEVGTGIIGLLPGYRPCRRRWSRRPTPAYDGLVEDDERSSAHPGHSTRTCLVG